MASEKNKDNDVSDFDKNISEAVHRYLADDGSFRASSVIATEVVKEMQQTLKAGPLAAVALGRSLMGAALMAAHLKDGHSVGVYFRGSGPLRTVYAESTFEGAVRAYTANSAVELPLKDGKLNLRDGIGIGLLEVVRGSPHSAHFHTGTVEILTGEIGDDLAYYLHQSQQIPSIIALTVSVDEYGLVTKAGGVLIELMPGAPAELFAQLQDHLKKSKSVSQLLNQSETTPDLLLQNFLPAGPKVEKISHPYTLKYQCRCSQERVERSLTLIGYQELDSMIEEAKPVVLNCDFCGREYHVDLERLQFLRQESFRKTLN